MMPVLAPILDVNSETGIIVSWHKQNRDEVKRGDAIVEIETSKSIIVVEAQDEGFLRIEQFMFDENRWLVLRKEVCEQFFGIVMKRGRYHV